MTSQFVNISKILVSLVQHEHDMAALTARQSSDSGGSTMEYRNGGFVAIYSLQSDNRRFLIWSEEGTHNYPSFVEKWRRLH